MAGKSGAASHAVAQNDRQAFFEALAREPYAFDFFQCLRRLECLYRELPRLGETSRPDKEAIRLGQAPSLRFAPSTVAALAPAENGIPPRLEVYFLGLFGPNGALPLHLSEYVYDRLKAHDASFARFADIFHHRMLALFYRAWANPLPTVSFDRPGPETDRFALYLGALFGFGIKPLWNRDALPDLAKLHYAGRFACQTRHAEGLRALLMDYFGLPAVIEEFVGHWMSLPEESRSRLGETPETGALGRTTVVGSQIWDCQHKFRIVIGPMELADYRRFLPGGGSLQRLVALVRNYFDDGLVWDLQLVLKKEQVPRLHLNGKGQLGWTTWLTRAPPAEPPLAEDAGDLKLNALAFSGG